jgi:nitrogen fixation NifU-like protein
MLLFQSQAHRGELADATHRGVAGEPGCGPFIALTFRVEAGAVKQAGWRTYGCPTAIACAEVVCVRSEGEPLVSLAGVTAEDVTRWVGGVIEGKEHCPELAARALAQAAGGAAPGAGDPE